VPLSPEELELLRAHAAVHEAAHAVAALELGLPLDHVAMAGDGINPRTGAYTNFGQYEAWRLMEERPNDMAPMSLAGTSAENYFFNSSIRDGATVDMQIIGSAGGAPSDDPAEVMEWLQPWVDQTRAIVREKRDAIETVAVALMSTDRLSRAEIEELVERSNTEPVHLLGHLTPVWRVPEQPEAR
jgi:ATP-dependent Zn protease